MTIESGQVRRWVEIEDIRLLPDVGRWLRKYLTVCMHDNITHIPLQTKKQQLHYLSVNHLTLQDVQFVIISTCSWDVIFYDNAPPPGFQTTTVHELSREACCLPLHPSISISYSTVTCNTRRDPNHFRPLWHRHGQSHETTVPCTFHLPTDILPVQRSTVIVTRHP